MATHTVIYGGGAQTISTVAYGADGEPEVPSSATYSIVDLRLGEQSSDREVVASTAATVDSFSATTAAQAGPGGSNPFRIDVDDVTGATEGTTYLLEDASGQKHAFVCDRIDTSNNYLYARSRIPRVFASSSSVTGIEVSGTFPSAEAADEDNVEQGGGPYAVDWVFTGVDPTRHRELIWIRRTTLPIYATQADLELLDQTIVHRGGTSVRADVALQQAHRDLYRKARGHGVDPARLHSEHARDAVTYRAAYWMAMGLKERENAKAFAAEWEALSSSLLEGSKPVESVYTDLDDEAEDGTSSIVHSKWRLT